MFWYHTEGNSPAYFIYSASAYHRNIDKHPFHNSEKNVDIYHRIDQLLSKNGFHKEILSPGRDRSVLSLVEKQILGKETADTPTDRILYLNEPCNLCLAVGGSELITIRSVLPGKAISESRLIASSAEELLDREFSFAYSDSLGYLTADPTLCGSAEILTAALFLPSLQEASERTALRSALSDLSITLSPLTTYGDNPGDIWLLQKKTSLAQSEERQAADLEALCESLAAKEEAKCRMIFAEKDKLIIDEALRAYGILTNAYLLSEADLLLCFSKIRRALASCDKEAKMLLPPLTFLHLNYLFSNCLDGTVLSESGQASSCRHRTDCDLLRANAVKDYLLKAVAEK